MSISALILILLGLSMILRNYKGTFLKTITLRAERIYTLILEEAKELLRIIANSSWLSWCSNLDQIGVIYIDIKQVVRKLISLKLYSSSVKLQSSIVEHPEFSVFICYL